MKLSLDYSEVNQPNTILLSNTNVVPPQHSDYILEQRHAPIREGASTYTNDNANGTGILQLTNSNNNQLTNVAGVNTDLGIVKTKLSEYKNLRDRLISDRQYDFNADSSSNRLSSDFVPGTRETALGDIQQQLEAQNQAYIYTSLGLISLVVTGILLNSTTTG